MTPGLSPRDTRDPGASFPLESVRVGRKVLQTISESNIHELIREMKEPDPEVLFGDLLPRFLFVAENVNVMNEAVAMARERWREVTAGDNTYQRPGSRMRRRPC